MRLIVIAAIVLIGCATTKPTEVTAPTAFDAEVETARLKSRLAELRAQLGKKLNPDFELEALARAFATRVCTLGDDPENHEFLVYGITGLGHGNSVISSTVSEEVPFVLLRDPTGDEPDWVTAVATCKLVKGVGEGKQFALFIGAAPTP